MKIFAISDIHEEYQRFDPRHFPDYDVLVIAGDITNYGKRYSRPWLNTVKWLLAVAKHGDRVEKPCLIIPGNHDVGVKDWDFAPLIDLAYRKIDLGGFSWYGIPLTMCYDMPKLATAWDHMTANGEAEEAAFEFDPVDVVVSHGPPYSIRDLAGIDLPTGLGVHLGSECLLDYIERHLPKLVICGHVHEATGASVIDYADRGETWVYNVARLGVLIDTDKLGEWEVVIEK